MRSSERGPGGNVFCIVWDAINSSSAHFLSSSECLSERRILSKNFSFAGERGRRERTSLPSLDTRGLLFLFEAFFG
jgi:hypothetical protein